MMINVIYILSAKSYYLIKNILTTYDEFKHVIHYFRTHVDYVQNLIRCTNTEFKSLNFIFTDT